MNNDIATNNDYFEKNDYLYRTVIIEKKEEMKKDYEMYSSFCEATLKAMRLDPKIFYIKSVDYFTFYIYKKDDHKFFMKINNQDYINFNITQKVYFKDKNEAAALLNYIIEDFKRNISKELLNTKDYDSISYKIENVKISKEQINNAKENGLCHGKTEKESKLKYLMEVSIYKNFNGILEKKKEYIEFASIVGLYYSIIPNVDDYLFLKNIICEKINDFDFFEENKHLISFNENKQISEHSKTLLMLNFKK